MTVVRELVTRLGFQVDQRGVEQFNRTIIGFKTKFAIAATAATAFVAKTLDFFNDIANATLDANDLAKSIGISFEEFIKLRRAAEEFRIDPSNFDAALSGLNKMLQDAQWGMGKLQEIAYYTGIEIRDNFTGELKNANQLFIDILKHINTLSNDRDKLKVAVAFFGEKDAQKYIDFAKAAGDSIGLLTEKHTEYAKALKDGIPSLSQYSRNLAVFKNQLTQLTEVFVVKLLPAITEALGIFTQILNGDAFKGFGVITDVFSTEGIKGGFSFIADAINEQVAKLFGGETLNMVKRKAAEEDAFFFNALIEQQKQGKLPANFNINTKVDMQIPPGTTEQQQTAIKQSFDEAFDNAFLDKIREIYNNNPQVE